MPSMRPPKPFVPLSFRLRRFSVKQIASLTQGISMKQSVFTKRKRLKKPSETASAGNPCPPARYARWDGYSCPDQNRNTKPPGCLSPDKLPKNRSSLSYRGQPSVFSSFRIEEAAFSEKRLARSAFPHTLYGSGHKSPPLCLWDSGKNAEPGASSKAQGYPGSFFDRHLKGDSVLGEHLLQYPGLVLKPVKTAICLKGNPILHQPPDPIRKITGFLKRDHSGFYHDFASALPAAGKPAAVLRESAAA